MTAKMHTERNPLQRGAIQFKWHLPLVLALTVLTNCSKILTIDDVPRVESNVDYRQLIATNFKNTFSDYATYSGVEISAPRLVDSMIGRTSLTCLRFEVKGRRRVYVYFIKNSAIATSRYDVQTDGCGAQSYESFNLITGSEGPATAPPQNPIY